MLSKISIDEVENFKKEMNLKILRGEIEKLKAEHHLNGVKLTQLEKLLSSPLLSDENKKNIRRECVKLSSTFIDNELQITKIELEFECYQEGKKN
jgi:hypothetical protein